MKTIKGNYRETESKLNEIRKKIEQNKAKTSQEIEAKQQLIKKLEEVKRTSLLNGNEAAYTKAEEEIKNASNSLIFLKETQKNIKAIAGLDLNTIYAFKKAITNEQDRITREALSEMEAALKVIYSWGVEVWGEITKGTELFTGLMNTYRGNSTEEEIKATFTGYDSRLNEQPSNYYVSAVNESIRKVTEGYLQQPTIKTFRNEK